MINPEYLLERISLKKKVTSWRIFSLFLLGVLIGSFFKTDADPASVYSGGYIARVRLEGVMLNDIDSIKKLRDIESNTSIKGVIISIDSPGGSAVAGEEYFDAIRHISKSKPVVSVLQQVAASAGYLAASGSDYIVAHKFTLTGSIGAIMQTYEVTELADKIGVKFINIKSSPLKASPNPFEKYTTEVADTQEELIQHAFKEFYDIVKDRRNLTDQEMKKVGSGRLFSGTEALKLKLVDEIGNEFNAVSWMQANRNIDISLPVRDYEIYKKTNKLDKILDSIHSMAVGLSGLFATKLI
jgi:protease-4